MRLINQRGENVSSYLNDIVNRAVDLDIYSTEWECLLDITNTGEEIDYKILSKFDDGNFTHDLVGIKQNISYIEKRLKGHFLPRSVREDL
jgi:hypothetical protein